MSDTAPALASRSIVAIADLELLRVARTDVDVVETVASPALGDRIRGLSPLALVRRRPRPRHSGR